MKAKTLQAHGAIPAGQTVTVIDQQVSSATVQFLGMDIVVPKDTLDFIDEEPPSVKPEPCSPPKPPAELVFRLEVDEHTEKAARLFYDNYTAAVGGIAFNGDKLPEASEFFEDPTKQKQANAWRVVAGNAIQLLHDAGILVDDGSEEAEKTAGGSRFWGSEDLLTQPEAPHSNWSVTPAPAEENPYGDKWIFSTTDDSGVLVSETICEHSYCLKTSEPLHGIPAFRIYAAILTQETAARKKLDPVGGSALAASQQPEVAITETTPKIDPSGSEAITYPPDSIKQTGQEPDKKVDATDEEL